MATDPRSLLRSSSATLSGEALLQARPQALRGVDIAAQTALEALQIRTVFDLAASQAFAAARRLLALQTDATRPEAQLQRLAADFAELPAGVPVAEAALLPISALRAVGPARAPALQAALAVATVRDLALWPPHLAARTLLAGQLTGDDPLPVGDPGTPPELLPKNGAFPTERVLYTQLVIDSATPTAAQPLEQLTSAIPIDSVLAASNQGFTRLATGALLSFSQNWFSLGVALGQLLHSLSLAPGESTRMAMIDWTRRSRASGSERISESERLANTTTHQRALSEVTEATASEVQGGSTRTTTEAASSQGGSALGFEVGPIAFGGSSGGGSTQTEARTVTSSLGRRELAASLSQRINDVSQQQASSARSRRASVVREVAQSEHEALSTRVVCNYNHMHALNVQYYEVVQAFRVTTRLERAERVLFVPVKLVDFNDAATLERWRAVLADVALSDEIRRQLTTEFGVVEVVPNTPRLRVGEAAVSAATRSAALAGVLSAAISPALAVGAASQPTAPALSPAPATVLPVAAPAPGGLAPRNLPLNVLAASRSTSLSSFQGLPVFAGSLGGATFTASGASASVVAAATDAVRSVRFDLGPPQAGATLTALKGFDARQLSRLASLAGRALLRNGSDAVFVPDDALLLGAILPAASTGALAVRNRAGADVAAGTRSGTQVTLATPLRLADVLSVTAQLRAGDRATETTLRLLVDIGGAALPLDVPVQLPAPAATPQVVEIVRFEAARAAPSLLRHLQANALHYSQAVFARLDSATLSAMLARFTLRGVPLGGLVDPQPVAVVANTLAFRLNLPLQGTVDNPALAAEQQAFTRFLQTRGLDRPAPRSETVPLPTGGVFAEAVLGRFNSAEKIDLTRFFDWQDSPIPLAPPDIAALPAGSRRRAVDLSTTALGKPVLQQTAPTAIPGSTGVAPLLAALQAGSPFRDLAPLISANAGLAQAGSEVTGAGATAAATQAAQTLQTVMAQNTERLKIAADLFTSQLAAQGGGKDGDKAAANKPTQLGLKMNAADQQDAAGKAAPQAGADAGSGASPSQIAAQASTAGPAPLEAQTRAVQTGSAAVSVADAITDAATAGVATDGAGVSPAAPRRAGRRVVQPSAPVGGSAPAAATSPTSRVLQRVISGLTDVPFSIQFQPTDGLLPVGQRTVRLSSADGRTLLTLQSSGNLIEGTRPANSGQVLLEVQISDVFNPLLVLRATRRLVQVPELGEKATQVVQVRPVIGTRKLAVAGNLIQLISMSAAQLRSLPEVQALPDLLSREARPPKVALETGGVVVTLSFFERELTTRQVIN